jgi:hypothetical protein
MKTFEEVRELLAAKFSKEKKRLKTFGTKTDSFQMANASAHYVLALMAEARNRELKRLDKKLDTCSNDDNEKVVRYVNERLKATSDMAKAINNHAELTEKKRPHGYQGRVRSSRH